jgi:hypothetical protein
MKLIGTLLIVLSSYYSFAQSPKDSVKQVISSLFEAMKTADTVRLRSCFASTGIADFCRSVGSSPAGTLDERIVFKDILMDDNLAVVWTPYQFFLKGVFSHCGVNSFQMVRLNGLWKIQYIIDTRRKNNCVE